MRESSAYLSCRGGAWWACGAGGTWPRCPPDETGCRRRDRVSTARDCQVTPRSVSPVARGDESIRREVVKSLSDIPSMNRSGSDSRVEEGVVYLRCVDQEGSIAH